MKLITTLDVNSEVELLGLRKGVERGLAAIARQAQGEARQMAVLGANMGIYLTPAGRYVRTEHYLTSITAAAQVEGQSVVLEVADSAEYATDLEYGKQGALNQAAAEQLAEAIGIKPEALYLGRSGENWIQPNPAVTRAAVFASLRMGNRLGALLAGGGSFSAQQAAD